MFQARVVEKTKAHILLSITFFPENHAVLEIMWKYVVEWGRPQMTIGRVRIVGWVPKATNTHLLYVILTAFLLQQWLHGSASLLRSTYSTLLVLHLTSALSFIILTDQQENLVILSRTGLALSNVGGGWSNGNCPA